VCTCQNNPTASCSTPPNATFNGSPTQCPNGYEIPNLSSGGKSSCVQFGLPAAQLTPGSATGLVNEFVALNAPFLSITVDGTTVVYDDAAVAVTGTGLLLGLFAVEGYYRSAGLGISFSACGMFAAFTDALSRKRSSNTFFTSSGPGQFIPATSGTTTSITGDPHVWGAAGIAYELIGKDGTVYVLFASRAIQVSARLMDGGPDAHFITDVGVQFGDAKLTFTWYKYNAEKKLAQLNAQLAPVGGKASLGENPFVIRLDLCPGYAVTVTQRWTIVNDVKYFHLNVDIEAPDCDDTLGGAIGETYQCKYAQRGEPFEWSAAKEDSFIVDDLFTPFGSFVASSQCDASNNNGKALSGGAAGSNGKVTMQRK